MSKTKPLPQSALIATKKLESFLRDELQHGDDIALHEPWIAGNEWPYVRDCLDSGWVSTVGGYVERFESEIAALCGTRYAVATVNGTAALHVALIALGVGRHDLVICPTLSFIGTANAISHCGAEPIFLDVCRSTLGLSAESLREFLDKECSFDGTHLIHRALGRRLAACVPVHVFGHPVDMDQIMDICNPLGIPVLEDAAEALGSRYKTRPLGSIGQAGALSFNGNKILTTGGGGMVVTNDAQLAEKLKHLTTTAKTPHKWLYRHDVVGYNYRLPNINAAMGCAQLESLNNRLFAKRRLSQMYIDLFADTNDITVFQEAEWAESNHWLNAIFMKDKSCRDGLLSETNTRGIQTRPCWDLLADLPMYVSAPRFGDLNTARNIVERVVSLPSSPQLLR